MNLVYQCSMLDNSSIQFMTKATYRKDKSGNSWIIDHTLHFKTTTIVSKAILAEESDLLVIIILI